MNFAFLGQSIQNEIDYQKSHSSKLRLKSDNNGKKVYRASWGEQFTALMGRAWKTVIKEPAVIRIQGAQSIVSLFVTHKYLEYHI